MCEVVCESTQAGLYLTVCAMHSVWNPSMTKNVVKYDAALFEPLTDADRG